MDQKAGDRRPPLSCQKCKWRFFTDQGLERHLLGVHSLVTSNMQSLVEQEKDSGRCTVCGKAVASKLVAHMREVSNYRIRRCSNSTSIQSNCHSRPSSIKPILNWCTYRTNVCCAPPHSIYTVCLKITCIASIPTLSSEPLVLNK